MRTRGEGVKIPENFGDVLYEWSLYVATSYYIPENPITKERGGEYARAHSIPPEVGSLVGRC